MAASSSDSRPRAVEHGRTTGAAGWRLGAALLCGALLLGAAARQEANVEGEYGLHVRLTADTLTVQWLTADSVAGALEVFGRGAPPRRTTPAGFAHRVAMARPRGDDVVLRYGVDGGALHDTRVQLTPPRRPDVEFRGVDSLYVVGDTHGDFDPLVRTLQNAGLINQRLAWTGGRRHLVFAGDLTDRGPYVNRLLWFVYRLEREAARVGGRVHVLLGNHETMVLFGDLRYVHPRETALAERHGFDYAQFFHTGESVLGRWIASKPAAIRIDRALIAHAGVVPEYSRLSLGDLDDMVAHYLKAEVLYREPQPLLTAADSLRHQAREDFFRHPRSLFWYRGYAQTDTVGAELDTVLQRYHAAVMVVGHTAASRIETRYEGRLITAHTPRFGAELLLLVRDRDSYQRFRIGEQGPPEPF